MRKVKLFVATSLDCYIAKKDDNIDWLFTGGDYGYDDFYSSIDTTLTGYLTYKQVLGFGVPFPYPDKTNYIFSRNHKQEDNNPVIFVSTDPAEFVRKLKEEKGKDIWLVGGGQINTILFNANLIDEMIISIHPVILGEGIPLFAGKADFKQFTLADTKTLDNGLLQVKFLL